MLVFSCRCVCVRARVCMTPVKTSPEVDLRCALTRTCLRSPRVRALTGYIAPHSQSAWRAVCTASKQLLTRLLSHFTPLYVSPGVYALYSPGLSVQGKLVIANPLDGCTVTTPSAAVAGQAFVILARLEAASTCTPLEQVRARAHPHSLLAHAHASTNNQPHVSHDDLHVPTRSSQPAVTPADFWVLWSWRLQHSLTRSLTHSLDHLLTQSRTHSRTRSITCSLYHALARSLPRSLDHSLIHSLIHTTRQAMLAQQSGASGVINMAPTRSSFIYLLEKTRGEVAQNAADPTILQVRC
jgi:hypothetical protein